MFGLFQRLSIQKDSLNLRRNIDEIVGGILQHIVDKGCIGREVTLGKVVCSTGARLDDRFVIDGSYSTKKSRHCRFLCPLAVQLVQFSTGRPCEEPELVLRI